MLAKRSHDDRAGSTTPSDTAKSALRRPTIVLSISQLLSWGALFYVFAVVAPVASHEAGWSTVALSGAFSVGMIASGLAAPSVGRALEHRGPRMTMSLGSLVGGVGMVTWATATTLGPVYVGWLLIGSAMAAVLYEPAVTTLMRIGDGKSRGAIVAVTTAGGLASTTFAPITHHLTAVIGWRSTVALVGVTVALITSGLHATLPRCLPSTTRTASTSADAARRNSPVSTLRTALVAEHFAMVAATAFLVWFLIERGASAGTATTALAALGVGKLGGRLALGAALHTSAPARVAVVVTAAQFGLFIAIAGVPPVVVLYGLALLSGACSGMTTVLRPLIIVELVGVADYTTVSARLQRASVFGLAAGPLAFGITTQIVGWTAAWVIVVGGFLVAARSFFRLGRIERPDVPAFEAASA